MIHEFAPDPPNVVRSRELAEAAAALLGVEPCAVTVRTTAVGPLLALSNGLYGFRFVASVQVSGEEVLQTDPVEHPDAALDGLGWLQ